jgi:hypothetical protein
MARPPLEVADLIRTAGTDQMNGAVKQLFGAPLLPREKMTPTAIAAASS